MLEIQSVLNCCPHHLVTNWWLAQVTPWQAHKLFPHFCQTRTTKHAQASVKTPQKREENQIWTWMFPRRDTICSFSFSIPLPLHRNFYMHKKPQLWNTMVIWSPHLTASDTTWENSWTAVECIPGTSSNDHIQTWDEGRLKINSITSNDCCNITRHCSPGDNYYINTCMFLNSLSHFNHIESSCTP